MFKKLSIFNLLPVELVEKILLHLTIFELYTFFQAFDQEYNILSDHFWRRVCLDEDFLQVSKHEEWFECFDKGVNKRLGNLALCHNPPAGKLEHVYATSIVTRDCLTNSYNIYSVDCDSKFELVQSINAKSVHFRDEFILTDNDDSVVIYKYDWVLNLFKVYRMLKENVNEVFGISSKFCSVFRSKEKIFNIYLLKSESEKCKTLLLPQDVKFVIEKILHLENIVISAVTYNDGYRIKMYDINTSAWTLDLKCFTSTGITNDPNVWVGMNFIACCDVSYRLRGIYFGPFKVWNKQGDKLFEAEIEPSNQHYLRCFFKNNHVLLTTSDDCVKIFDSFGGCISCIKIQTSFEDIKLSTGYMLFVLVKETPTVYVYNWKTSCLLYSVPLPCDFSFSLFSDSLYCPYNVDKYAVYKFFSNT